MRKGAGDADHLPLRQRKFFQRFAQIDFLAEPVQQCLRVPLHLRTVQQAAESPQFAPDKNVIYRVQMRKSGGFLMQRHNARRFRRPNSAGRNRFSVYFYASRVRPDGSRKTFDKGGLSRAVLAHQRVDFSGGKAQADPGKRQNAAVGFT